MEKDELIKLPASSNSVHGSGIDDRNESDLEAIESDCLPPNSELKAKIHEEEAGTLSNDDDVDMSISSDEENSDRNTPVLKKVDVETSGSAEAVVKMTPVSHVHAQNGSLSVQQEIIFSNQKNDETLVCKEETNSNSVSGAKRPRISVDERQPSVRVIYSSLPRESKLKLEELLQQWSKWHSEKCSSSNDPGLESGEETYFPALQVGLDKPSAIDSTSVPLYDRGYSLALTSGDDPSSLEGGMEKLDTSRCFNCSSYSHALKDCPKPRDSVAVNNARREHRSRRNQNSSSRNLSRTRYYQSSRGGKYDGLTPGVLDAETRRVLGLGELDPPPWLHRMRELGYPPGYLDQPSGIIIFGEEVAKEEGEEGEILDSGPTELSKKKTVDFPGINAPIPKNADEWLWARNPSFANLSGYNSQRRHNNRTYENLNTSERRWSRDLDDVGPPGCEPGTSPSLSNHFPRYGDHDYGLSPGYSRPMSDRGRRSPRVHDGSPSQGHYGNLSYTSPSINGQKKLVKQIDFPRPGDTDKILDELTGWERMPWTPEKIPVNLKQILPTMGKNTNSSRFWRMTWQVNPRNLKTATSLNFQILANDVAGEPEES
ncbi:prolinerich spliceosome-associated family protein / zinc knuckle family protein [Striga asiatica]|uniref:Prolinerich spliceosome-associated family protein / zinc knuckle family protein n=1 Tax=Striga asiatica TaxID=4170 RepID=A0A5A7PS66_STRAF|nr:prolinerich spliceosome-associated family protein / zinc knuckle family protein [Striga asiatica]